MDLAYLIRRAARQFPDACAVSDRSSAVTLSAVVDCAERLANALDQLGVPSGATIGVLSENRVEYPVVDLGIALARRVRVALNARLHREDFRYALQDCDARVLVHSAAFAEDAAALADELGLLAITLDDPEFDEKSYAQLIADSPATPVIRPGDDEEPAWISYTSGTTGKPKGVVLSHRAIREVALNLLLELGPVESGDRIVLAQPLSHGAGYFVIPRLIAGGGVHVLRQFDPAEVIWASTQPGVTTLKAVPAMFPPLLDACKERGASCQYETIIYGAAPMPGPVLEQALEMFGPVLVQIYGQSEAPVTLTCMHKRDHATAGRQWGSAGRPWRSVALEVRNPDGEPVPPGETGEITIHGPHHMSGYHNLPEATVEVIRDGWVWTKDMGSMDEAGYVYLLGRRDEMINSGGFNISPREVERVLQAHPAVEECAVIGLPDDRWGSAVSALVRLKGDTQATADELLSFVRPRLAFRTPKRLLLTDVIPKNAYGKVDRSKVVAALSSIDGVTDGSG